MSHGGQEVGGEDPPADFRILFAANVEQVVRAFDLMAAKILLHCATITYFSWYRQRRGTG